jgi:hypothetical protein
VEAGTETEEVLTTVFVEVELGLAIPLLTGLQKTAGV